MLSQLLVFVETNPLYQYFVILDFCVFHCLVSATDFELESLKILTQFLDMMKGSLF